MDTKSDPILSIILPAYNEGKNIRSSIKRVSAVVDSLGIGYEIIIVDDGSTDDTKYQANEEASNRRVKVISYDENLGKGFALRRGFNGSSGDFIIFLDSDSDIDAKKIGMFVDALSTADIVIASKRHPQSRVESPFLRKFLSHSFYLIVRLLTWVNVSDTQTGLKAFRRTALQSVFRLTMVKRFALDVELLCVASILKLKIKEMPVTLNLDSKISLKDISRLFIDILGIAYRLRIIHWYQKNLDNSTPKYNPIIEH